MNEQSRQEHHKMELVFTHPSGVDELFCPTCGRRILLQWPPDYKKTVIDPGDMNAIHSAGKGGLEMSAPQLVQKPDMFAQDAGVRGANDDTIQLSAQDEYRLVQWEQWLNQMDFDKYWSGSG